MTVEVTPLPAAEAGNRPSEASAKEKKQREAQARKEILAPVNGAMTGASVLVAIAAVCGVVPFILIVELCRELLADPADTGRVWRLLWIAVAVLGVRALLQAGALTWSHLVDASYQLTVRRALAAKLSRVPLGWFSDRTSSEVKQYLRDDVEALHYLIAHARLEFVGAVVAPVVTLIYLFTVDWRLTLVLLVPLVAYAVALSKMMDVGSRDRLAVYHRWERRVQDAVVEFVDGIQVVRAFGQAGRAHGAYQEAVDGQARSLDRWKTPMIRLQAASDIVVAPVFVMLVVVLAGLAAVGLDWVSALDLLPFLLVGLGLGSSLLGLGYGGQALRTAGAAAVRLHELQQTPELVSGTGQVRETAAVAEPGTGAVASSSSGSPAADAESAGVESAADEAATNQGDGSGAAQLPRQAVATGVVQFEGVEFGYRDDHQVLRGVDLTLRPGTLTALVGPSGSGKSTLAKLLPRFYDVDAGRITIDGCDIRDFGSAELYRQVGFVFQDVRLIHGSIRDNLQLARSDADDAALESAARAAQIHDRIVALPRGYDSEIGIDATLSGGEAQRLSIARALLADTPVLVLDEATAFADPESEAAVQDALARLVAGRTVLVIAHRLHTITGVDRILVLEHGELVEQGTHTELSRAGGTYQRLWELNEAAVHAAALVESEAGR